MSELTHFNEQGRAKMVDVTEKAVTHRTAVAAGEVHMSPGTLEKIKAGTLKTTSVRYAVDSWEEVAPGKTSADGRFTGPCQIARKWTPMEVSIVSVPADATVGVGRADGEQTAGGATLSLYERQIQINKNRHWR